nr:unnamed protein product [Callosobruchus analis]
MKPHLTERANIPLFQGTPQCFYQNIFSGNTGYTRTSKEEKRKDEIIIFPPDDGEVTDEDSGEEDNVVINNLPGAQLRTLVK